MSPIFLQEQFCSSSRYMLNTEHEIIFLFNVLSFRSCIQCKLGTYTCTMLVSFEFAVSKSQSIYLVMIEFPLQINVRDSNTMIFGPLLYTYQAHFNCVRAVLSFVHCWLIFLRYAIALL